MLMQTTAFSGQGGSIIGTAYSKKSGYYTARLKPRPVSKRKHPLTPVRTVGRTASWYWRYQLSSVTKANYKAYAAANPWNAGLYPPVSLTGYNLYLQSMVYNNYRKDDNIYYYDIPDSFVLPIVTVVDAFWAYYSNSGVITLYFPNDPTNYQYSLFYIQNFINNSRGNNPASPEYFGVPFIFYPGFPGDNGYLFWSFPSPPPPFLDSTFAMKIVHYCNGIALPPVYLSVPVVPF